MNEKPDFKKISIFSNKQPNEDRWKKTVEEKMNQSITNLLYETNEGISTKILYTEQDIKNIRHLHEYSRATALHKRSISNDVC